jgi:hypothetical protein
MQRLIDEHGMEQLLWNFVYLQIVRSHASTWSNFSSCTLNMCIIWR